MSQNKYACFININFPWKYLSFQYMMLFQHTSLRFKKVLPNLSSIVYYDCQQERNWNSYFLLDRYVFIYADFHFPSVYPLQSLVLM